MKKKILYKKIIMILLLIMILFKNINQLGISLEYIDDEEEDGCSVRRQVLTRRFLGHDEAMVVCHWLLSEEDDVLRT